MRKISSFYFLRNGQKLQFLPVICCTNLARSMFIKTAMENNQFLRITHLSLNKVSLTLTVPLSTITCQQVKLNTLVQNYLELNFRSIHNYFLSYLIFSNQYFKSIMFMFFKFAFYDCFYMYI